MQIQPSRQPAPSCCQQALTIDAQSLTCVHAQVQAKALRGVGAALPALTAGAPGSPGAGAALDAFLDAVDGASRATEPTEMRAAAVRALQASSLLQPASADGGGACL